MLGMKLRTVVGCLRGRPVWFPSRWSLHYLLYLWLDGLCVNAHCRDPAADIGLYRRVRNLLINFVIDENNALQILARCGQSEFLN